VEASLLRENSVNLPRGSGVLEGEHEEEAGVASRPNEEEEGNAE